jgi:hypothetical protein
MSIMGMVLSTSGEFFGIETPYSDTEVFQIFLDEAGKQIKPQKNARYWS